MVTLFEYVSRPSPLFFVLQALLNASNVNGDMEVVKEAVLYLLCIFRAIKKAEDAVHAEKTTVIIFLDESFYFILLFNIFILFTVIGYIIMI